MDGGLEVIGAIVNLNAMLQRSRAAYRLDIQADGQRPIIAAVVVAHLNVGSQGHAPAVVEYLECTPDDQPGPCLCRREQTTQASPVSWCVSRLA